LDCGNKAITAILATKEGPVNVLLVGAEDRTICLRDAQSGSLFKYIAKKHTCLTVKF
jgi:hypothetical protein